jgi:N-acetylglucosamine kinase-like BadF-type ATPase
MKLVAGVCIDDDSARSAIADDSGRVLARVTLAVAPCRDGPADVAGRRTMIVDALGAARAAAGAVGAVEALVVGLSAYHEEASPVPVLDGMAHRYAVLPFALTAQIGALDGKPGIVVAVGMGSVAVGTSPFVSGFIQAGGWGYPFGDDGGAYSIGREAVRSALAVADRGEPASRLGQAALEFFSISSLCELSCAYARGEITRHRIAEFSRVALELATSTRDWPEALDRDAFFVRMIAANALVSLALTVDARLPALPDRAVSYAGSLFSDAGLLEKFAWMLEMRRISEEERRTRENAGEEDEIRRVYHAPTPMPRAPELRPVAPVGDALDGSLLLARYLLGAQPSSEPLTSRDALEFMRI